MTKTIGGLFKSTSEDEVTVALRRHYSSPSSPTFEIDDLIADCVGCFRRLAEATPSAKPSDRSCVLWPSRTPPFVRVYVRSLTEPYAHNLGDELDDEVTSSMPVNVYWGLNPAEAEWAAHICYQATYDWNEASYAPAEIAKEWVNFLCEFQSPLSTRFAMGRAYG